MIDLSYRDIYGNLQEKQETANSYVISKPGEYCFPLIMGNGIKEGRTNYLAFTNQKLSKKQADFYDYLDRIITSPELIGGKSISIISWDSSREFIKNLKVEEDYIKFITTNIPEEGANYVIGILDKENRIIWSWHIWLWKKKLESVEIGKYKILNTNLATKGGKSWHYQWGRKDPTCFFDKMVNIKECSDSIGQSIQHPGTFYLPGDRRVCNYNWVKKKFYYNYWNSRCNKEQVDEEIIKTIYDPCPPGYTIPGYSVFTNLKEDHYDRNGWVLNNGKIFFPASGCRDSDSGAVNSIGSEGFYWSAGAYSVYDASYLYFNSRSVFPLTYNYHAFGFSVRPMKERVD